MDKSKGGYMRHGFTLLELLLVSIATSLLLSLLLPLLMQARTSARRAQTEALLERVGHALENYRLAYGSFPAAPGGTGMMVDGGLTPFRPGFYQVPCAPAGAKANGSEDNSALIQVLAKAGFLTVRPSEVADGVLVDSFGNPVIVRFLIGAPTADSPDAPTGRYFIWTYGPDRTNGVNASATYTNQGQPSYDDAEIARLNSIPVNADDIRNP